MGLSESPRKLDLTPHLPSVHRIQPELALSCPQFLSQRAEGWGGRHVAWEVLTATQGPVVMSVQPGPSLPPAFPH